MDIIIRELEDKIVDYSYDHQMTDVACCYKIKMDYFLMLTIAATWDIKHLTMDETRIKKVMNCLQRPETGKLITLIKDGLGLNQLIVNIFDEYKTARNLNFGHITFDEFVSTQLNAECKQCWNKLMTLSSLEDKDSDLIRKLYQENNDFYYVKRLYQDGNMKVRQLGNRSRIKLFPQIGMQARLANKDNVIQEGDLFISVDNKYIKVSPFIQYDNINDLFLMLMDVETVPSLAFKMAYVYRRGEETELFKYLDNFPKELKSYFPEAKKTGKNGIALNRFTQYELFEQEYYQGIHKNVQTQLDQFIMGNMVYGAVRGVAGVGKTSTVFIWMKRVLNNVNGILNNIRNKFNLKRIIFLSAKKKIYSREINNENMSNFYEIESDVHDYCDIVEKIYAVTHPLEKSDITFNEKTNYIKDYSNQTNCILIIIDDYESLPEESRNKILRLKDELNPNVVKILITTRFPAKESKDIIVEPLDEIDCAIMADNIFESKDWKNDITINEMHNLTGGIPLLIWYAKAYFKMGQLSIRMLKDSFSGPDKGLEDYLYDNFAQCFEHTFTKNFLMIATENYEQYNVLQLSKIIAVFLCLKEPKEYKTEDEEFYFRELEDLKLISINRTTNSIDYSPLMPYMDKSTKKQKPEEEYQEDAFKLLLHLDEAKYQGLYAVLESAEHLDATAKYRVLKRIYDFTQNDIECKALAIKKLFLLSTEKIGLYETYMQFFQSNLLLIKTMLEYLLDNRAIIKDHYELFRDYMTSLSITIDKQSDVEMIVQQSLDVIHQLLLDSFEAREEESITNSELEKRALSLRGLAISFAKRMQNKEGCIQRVDGFNKTIVEDVSVYCEIKEIGRSEL